MRVVIACLLFLIVVIVESVKYENVTLYQPSDRQLLDFKLEHPVPVGLWTKNSGDPTEIRDTLSVNSDISNHELFLEALMTHDGERIPERVVHAKGGGAFGYFEVTHDVSKYTYADVFNGIGKRTPLITRFSTGEQKLGGSDLARELKGLAIKMYTKQGNLDLLCLQAPVYFYRDPILFPRFVRAFKRNPKTDLFDNTATWDIMTQEPVLLHNRFYLFADYGIPHGYRRMDAFPIHTYEIANKHGETYYVRFNFRTEQGFTYLTSARAQIIQGWDKDYFIRDMYNNIKQKNFPAWRLEMDVIPRHDLLKLDYDPFDETRLWKNGTFFTVQIGRLLLNKYVDNQFRDVEQAAFNPGNLVPGIPGPVTELFKSRRLAYRDTQNYRIGRNHHKILINMPLYFKNYQRDGIPPMWLNGLDAPNYYPNSYNGPISYVDEKRPKKKIRILERNAVDFERLSYFYNHILDNEPHRQRFIDNIAESLVGVTSPVLENALRLIYLIDNDFGKRTKIALDIAIAEAAKKNAEAATCAPGPYGNLVTAEAQNYHTHY